MQFLQYFDQKTFLIAIFFSLGFRIRVNFGNTKVWKLIGQFGIDCFPKTFNNILYRGTYICNNISLVGQYYYSDNIFLRIFPKMMIFIFTFCLHSHLPTQAKRLIALLWMQARWLVLWPRFAFHHLFLRNPRNSKQEFCCPGILMYPTLGNSVVDCHFLIQWFRN